MIVELSGSRSGIAFCPLPTDDPKTRLPDISKAYACLDWEPRISPNEGLKRVVEWFRENTDQRQKTNAVIRSASVLFDLQIPNGRQ
jgi:nucleoside-diphosphate-sugar epimerase